jgi:hypothetical protein
MREARIATSDIECEVHDVRRIAIQRMIAREDVAGGVGRASGPVRRGGIATAH